MQTESPVEHPFGHIKRNLKTDGFMIRGQTGVNAETSLLGTCFNLARMITILGVSGLIEKLRATESQHFDNISKDQAVQGSKERIPVSSAALTIIYLYFVVKERFYIKLR